MSYARYSSATAPSAKTERDPRSVERGLSAQVSKSILLATGQACWIEHEPGQPQVLVFEGYTADPPRSAQPTVTVGTYRQALEWALQRFPNDPALQPVVSAPSFSAEQLKAMLAALEGGNAPKSRKDLA